MGRVVRVHGADADAIALSIDPLPDDAPAIVTYFAGDTRSAAEMVSSVLQELEKVAIGLFPAWLPGAEGVGGPGGAGGRAVRALALRAASATEHFGPFLADLAERALRGAGPLARRGAPREARTRRSPGFAAEIRGRPVLGRVIAASFGRSRAAVLVRVPADLSPPRRRPSSRDANGWPTTATWASGSPASRWPPWTGSP